MTANSHSFTESGGMAEPKKQGISSKYMCIFVWITLACLVVAVVGIVMFAKGANVECTIKGADLINNGQHDALVKGHQDDNDDDDDDDDDDAGDDNEVPKDRYPYQATLKRFRYAGIASDERDCAAIGNDVMVRYGGSAVDGAIATAFCNGATNYHLSGIGGGFIMVVYAKEKGSDEATVHAIVARESAPAAATADMYVANQTESIIGGKSIGVPGEVLGMYEAWRRFGKVPEWRMLIEPTVELCRNGIPVTKNVYDAFAPRRESLQSEEFREIQRKGERDMEIGDRIAHEKLAATMQAIADDPYSFYNGSLARDIAADIQEAGGIITEDDLANYQIDNTLLSTLHLNNGNYTVYSAKPPAGGTAFQYMLNILDSYNISTKDNHHPELIYHRMIEAFKFSFAKRGQFGDSAQVDNTELVDQMLSSTFGESIRGRIDDDTTHSAEYYRAVANHVDDHGTAHVSVLGPDGSAVAVTPTINYYFGSKVRGKRTGIIFNNQMADFSIPGSFNPSNSLAENTNNYPAPGKRPMSSTCPSIVVDSQGEARLVIGTAGGAKIPTATAEVFIHHVWMGLPLDEAISRPRIHHQLYPQHVLYETGLNATQYQYLHQRGHHMQEKGMFSAVHAVSSSCDRDDITTPDSGCVHAVADDRRRTVADGY